MFTLKQLHVGLINSHTVAWLMSNILSNKGAPRKPSKTTELQGAITPPVKSAPLVANGVGLESWLAFYDLMFLSLMSCTSTGISVKQRREKQGLASVFV